MPKFPDNQCNRSELPPYYIVLANSREDGKRLEAKLKFRDSSKASFVVTGPDCYELRTEDLDEAIAKYNSIGSQGEDKS